MIAENNSTFFTVLAEGEVAQHVASELAPGAAHDIIEVSMVSEDFSDDISVLHDLDKTLLHMKSASELDVTVDEKFNPLYMPVKPEQLDDVLQAEIRTDGMKFIGFEGNPFTIKLVTGTADGRKLLVGLAQYHPFELPSYNDIIAAHEHVVFN